MPSLEDQLAAQQYGALKGQPFPPGVLTRITDLSSDQLAHLTSRPPVFVPAPGPGKALAFIAAYCLTNPGTIPFNGAQAFGIGYVGGNSLNAGTSPLFGGGATGQLTQAAARVVDEQPFLGDNSPLVAVDQDSDDPSGAILAFSIADGGALYAPGDTVNCDFFNSSVFVVDTVDGGGAVLTGHFTNRGFAGVPGVGLTTNALTGSGMGLTFTVTSITPANGTARVWTLYTVLDLP